MAKVLDKEIKDVEVLQTILQRWFIKAIREGELDVVIADQFTRLLARRSADLAEPPLARSDSSGPPLADPAPPSVPVHIKIYSDDDSSSSDDHLATMSQIGRLQRSYSAVEAVSTHKDLFGIQIEILRRRGI